jgi:hypothetical protein
MTSAIEPTYGKGISKNRSKTTSGSKGYTSKTNESITIHTGPKKKPSLSDHDSSKHLVFVPEDYGRTVTDVQAVPLQNLDAAEGLRDRSRSMSMERSRLDGEDHTSRGIIVTKTYDVCRQDVSP